MIVIMWCYQSLSYCKVHFAAISMYTVLKTIKEYEYEEICAREIKSNTLWGQNTFTYSDGQMYLDDFK